MLKFLIISPGSVSPTLPTLSKYRLFSPTWETEAAGNKACRERGSHRLRIHQETDTRCNLGAQVHSQLQAQGAARLTETFNPDSQGPPHPVASSLSSRHPAPCRHQPHPHPAKPSLSLTRGDPEDQQADGQQGGCLECHGEGVEADCRRAVSQ